MSARGSRVRARLGVGGLVASVSLLPTAALAVLPPGGTFFDDDGNFHEPMIEAIAAAGITNGCNAEGTKFCPSDEISRAEVAAMINRALVLPPASMDYFSDDNGNIHEDDINRLAEAGITNGCGPGLYCPDLDLTRAQMASLIVRGWNYVAGAGNDTFIDDDGHFHEDDIDRLAEAGVTNGCDPVGPRFCPDDPVLRDQMASFIGRAEELDPIVPPPRPGLKLEPYATGFSFPVLVTAPTKMPAGDDRLWVVEQHGRIKVIDNNGSVLGTPFLDLSSKVLTGGENGLLGMAFHPNYATNGKFYVHYSASGGPGHHRGIIAEYKVSPGDPNVADVTERVLMTITQPYSNHNGGHLEFGPDGYLYIGLGDGGSHDDPQNRSRNPNDLLGSVLRIDVNAIPYASPPDNPYVGIPGRDEIWAIGVRNPWRFSFHDGKIWIGDVGQDRREEVDVVPAVPAGYDFGWSQYEGTRCNTDAAVVNCSTAGITMPTVEYTHSEGHSVSGGVVYRGETLPHMVGHYFYGDWASDWIRSFRLDNGQVVDEKDWTSELGLVNGVVSFGNDRYGELYVVSVSTGTVYRLEYDN